MGSLNGVYFKKYNKQSIILQSKWEVKKKSGLSFIYEPLKKMKNKIWKKNACPASNQANHVFVCIYSQPLTQWMIRIAVCGSVATTLRQSYTLKYSKFI